MMPWRPAESIESAAKARLALRTTSASRPSSEKRSRYKQAMRRGTPLGCASSAPRPSAVLSAFSSAAAASFRVAVSSDARSSTRLATHAAACACASAASASACASQQRQPPSDRILGPAPRLPRAPATGRWMRPKDASCLHKHRRCAYRSVSRPRDLEAHAPTLATSRGPSVVTSILERRMHRRFDLATRAHRRPRPWRKAQRQSFHVKGAGCAKGPISRSLPERPAQMRRSRLGAIESAACWQAGDI